MQDVIILERSILAEAGWEEPQKPGNLSRSLCLEEASWLPATTGQVMAKKGRPTSVNCAMPMLGFADHAGTLKPLLQCISTRDDQSTFPEFFQPEF